MEVTDVQTQINPITSLETSAGETNKTEANQLLFETEAFLLDISEEAIAAAENEQRAIYKKLFAEAFIAAAETEKLHAAAETEKVQAAAETEKAQAAAEREEAQAVAEREEAQVAVEREEAQVAVEREEVQAAVEREEAQVAVETETIQLPAATESFQVDISKEAIAAAENAEMAENNAETIALQGLELLQTYTNTGSLAI